MGFSDNVNQKENKDIYIGTDTRFYLKKNESKCDEAQFLEMCMHITALHVNI